MKITLITLTIIIAFFLITCSENNQPRDPLGSPTDTLITFVNAHNNYKDSQALKDLSSTLTDDMIFYFDIKDVGQYNGHGYMIPYSWDREDFFSACQNMFNNVYSINFNIPGLENGIGEPQGDEFSAYDIDISILLYISQTNGYMTQGPVNWKFKKGADNKWRISEIHDNTVPEILNISSSSWGTILAEFH